MTVVITVLQKVLFHTFGMVCRSREGAGQHGSLLFQKALACTSLPDYWCVLCADPGREQAGVQVCCFRRFLHAQVLLTVSVFCVQILKKGKKVWESIMCQHVLACTRSADCECVLCAEPGREQEGLDNFRARMSGHTQGLLTVSVSYVQIQEESKKVWKFIIDREIEAPARFQAIQSYR